MFLIIQTGDPVEKVQTPGSFADWFVAGMGLHEEQVKVVNVHKGEQLPDYNSIDWTAVIVTGSVAMITEQLAWMKHTQRWLAHAFTHDLPTLGVCFGHQLIADMLGGKVGYNPLGRHMGVSQFTLNDNGLKDDLLGSLTTTNSFNTFVSHQQNVIELPDDVTLLGSCPVDLNHAFRYKQHIWCVQFHPEWTANIMQGYIKQRQDVLAQEGFNPTEMVSQLGECKVADNLLKRFAKLAFIKQQS